MERSQFWLLALCSWLFLLYNIERISEPINLASFTYVFVIVCANLVILVRWLRRTPSYKSFFLSLPAFFFLKVYFGYEIAGTNLPITVTEMCAIGITIFLTKQVTWHLEEFREVISRLTIGRLEAGTHAFEEGQGHIYREIRRARLYKRPATLLALSVSENLSDFTLSRFVKEAQREVIHRYVAARTANLLVKELKDCDVITKRNDHFIILLPETDREVATEIANKLSARFREELGLASRIGLSTFPDEAVTFESLLKQAESTINSPPISDRQRESILSASAAESGPAKNGPAMTGSDNDDVETKRENRWNNES